MGGCSLARMMSQPESPASATANRAASVPTTPAAANFAATGASSRRSRAGVLSFVPSFVPSLPAPGPGTAVSGSPAAGLPAGRPLPASGAAADTGSPACSGTASGAGTVWPARPGPADPGATDTSPSASSRVCRSWATSSTVTLPRKPAMARLTTVADSRSRWAVGSSSSRTVAPAAIRARPRASATRRSSPGLSSAGCFAARCSAAQAAKTAARRGISRGVGPAGS